VLLQVSDGGNGNAAPPATDQQSIRVIVRTTNDAPVLLPIGDLTVAEGQNLVGALSAVDPDHDPLVFEASHLPPGAVLDLRTGTLRWTPTFLQAGDYEAIFLPRR